MTPPFLLLLAAAGIFRWLSFDANNAFRARLALLLPRNVIQNHMEALVREHRNRLGEFRWKVAPYFALHVALNAAACACFIPALWYFPPSGLDPLVLGCLRYGSLLLTPLAFLVDLVALARMVIATLGGGAEAGGAL